jgi:molybdopterin biosynthesis enzyme
MKSPTRGRGGQRQIINSNSYTLAGQTLRLVAFILLGVALMSVTQSPGALPVVYRRMLITSGGAPGDFDYVRECPMRLAYRCVSDRGATSWQPGNIWHQGQVPVFSCRAIQWPMVTFELFVRPALSK